MGLPANILVSFSEGAIARAVDLWRAGRCVAFPTETVYGLGARADDESAVARIFAAKGRPANNPLIVHVASVDDVERVAARLPPEALALAGAFWPGPLSLILPARPGAVASRAVAGGSTVAVRIPSHPAAAQLLRAAATPIAAPSANRSNRISPTEAGHVMSGFDDGIDLVVDGGPTGYGIESSIVDVTTRPFSLLRYGAVPLSSLQAHAEIVDRVAAAVAGEPLAAPGRLSVHYAPRARLELCAPEALEALRSRYESAGERVGVVCRTARAIRPTDLLVEVLPDDAAAYAARIFASLHRLDDAGCDAILVAEVPADPAWAAVSDRLRRGARAAS